MAGIITMMKNFIDKHRKIMAIIVMVLISVMLGLMVLSSIATHVGEVTQYRYDRHGNRTYVTIPPQ